MSKRPHNAKNVNVYVRLRDDETTEGPSIFKKEKQPVITTIYNNEHKQFKFTDVFTSDDDNTKIFDNVARPLLDNLLVKNKDGIIFTYGRTGAGKTFTMEGFKDDGLIFRSFDYVFDSIGRQQTHKGSIKLTGDRATLVETGYYPSLSDLPSVKQAAKMFSNGHKIQVDTSKHYCVFISVVELYMKEVRDLLPLGTRQKIDLTADSQLTGASQHEVKSADEAARLYKKAKNRRTTLKTTLNENSSRGHLVLIIRLVSVDNFKNISEPIPQFCLVDLAGCERTKQSCVSGSGFQEACSINNSLGALRLCIKSLKENTRVQYRNDNLTKLLKRFLEGHGTISMILCVKPDPESFKDNLYVMEFGTQTKDVKMDYASPTKPRSTKEQVYHWLERARAAESARKRRKINRRDQRNKDIALFNKVAGELRARLVAREEEYAEIEEKSKATLSNFSQLESKFDILKLKMEQREQTIKELKHMLHNETSDKEYYAKKLNKLVRCLPTNAPSAPMQSSSPIPTESTDPLTASSSGTMEYHRQADDHNRSPTKAAQGSTVPVVNPRHNRSLSCSSLQWIHHKPRGTIDTGTVLKPKFKNGRSVKKLRSSDILRRDAGGYSVVHQDADNNGEVETKVYKGHIISTVCGGAQVILDDIETMKQTSPETKRRAASDVHYDY